MKNLLNYWSATFLVYTSLMIGYSFGQIGQVTAQIPIDEYTSFIIFVKMTIPFILGWFAGYATSYSEIRSIKEKIDPPKKFGSA